MEKKKRFIPLCFKKDLKKLLIQFKLNSKNDKVLLREMYVNLEAKEIYTILKNLDLSIKKCMDIEYSKQRLNIEEANKQIRVAKNCDVYSFKAQHTIFKLIKYTFQFKVIRFYSFSNINNCYFFLYNVMDQNQDKKKYCKGGIVIPMAEKKILIFMKQSKKLSAKFQAEIFGLLVENCKVILEVMGKFISRDEIERLSTVETLETETDSETVNNMKVRSEGEIVRFNLENELEPEINGDLFEEGVAGKIEEYSDNELIEYGDLDLDFIENQSELMKHKFLKPKFVYDTPMKEMKSSEFIIDEDDEDYNRVRKLNLDDLSRYNLLDEYYELKKQMENDVKEYKIDENELIRYVYGWKGDVVNIKENLIELQQWRNTYNFHKYEYFKSVEYDLEKLANVICQDVYGRPVIFIKAKYLTKKLDVELFSQYVIYLMEKACSIMPANVDKTALIIDIKDAGLDNFSLSHLNAIQSTTKKFYVERLSNLIVINKGFFFGVLWKVVSKFLEERLLKKLIVLDDSKMNWMKKILGPNFDKVMLG